MPIIEKGDLVLVTGASGFLASHAVLAFLQAGYRVRGTVRSKQKGEYLSRLCTSKGLIGFSYVLVPDISVAGAFDDAVVGIDALAHLASPFYTANVADPQELIGPAVNGTVGILKSIANKGVKVKRVVITSSVAAIMSPESRPPPQRYTSEDWNEDSIVQLARNGASSGGVVAYRASKTLAEKAFWDFIEIEKPEWDGIVLNPPLILGEVIHEVESPDRLNTSVAAFWKWLSGQQAESDLPSPLGNYINVKDIALAHVNALSVPEAAGRRLIVGNGPFSGQDYCDVIHENYPQRQGVPIGRPGTHAEIAKRMDIFDGSQARAVLGIEYKDFKTTVTEMTDSLLSRWRPEK